MRRAARTDANQQAVVDALRKVGAVVTPLHRVGQGVADLLVSFRQTWLVMEVKDGSKPPSDRRLTEDEARWIGAQRAPVYIVNSPLEAVDIVKRIL